MVHQILIIQKYFNKTILAVNQFQMIVNELLTTT